MIETGRRSINDIGTRRHIAHTLGLPTYVFGVTDGGDADYAAMIQFGDSTIRLAEIARQAGRAVAAVNELWPLIARLETRAIEGHIERDTLILLGQARVALGVSLGTVLPEERLAAAARWTGKAMTIAERLDSPSFLAHTLRMHGNEHRKANRVPAAITRLYRAVDLSTDRQGQGTALAFLEIHLRGLISTGRAAEAIRIMQTSHASTTPAAPQWHIIERVTAGQVHLAAGDRDGAGDALRTALTTAEAHRLPHQIQRTIRTAQDGGLTEISIDGQASLLRLNRLLLTPPEPES